MIGDGSYGSYKAGCYGTTPATVTASWSVELEADSTAQQDAATVYGAMILRFPGAKPDWVTGDVAHYTLDEDTGHGNGNGNGNG